MPSVYKVEAYRNPPLPAAKRVVCLICYKIGKHLNIEIQDELASRRKKFAAA
jgi:hypothetical protein